MATAYNNDEQGGLTKKGQSRKKADIIAAVRKRLEEAYEADRENRRQAALDLSFLSGDQWDTATSEARRKARRPMLTINRLPAFIQSVVNDMRMADMDIKVSPVGDEDSKITKIYNGLLKQIQYRNSATCVYSQAVFHQVACGIGYFRIGTEYADDESFDQEITIEPINNPLSVYFDPGAERIDRDDAQWCMITEEVPIKTFEARYPQYGKQELPVATDYVRDNLHWFSKETIRIAEYWVKEPVTRTLAQTPEGETVDITDWDKLMKDGTKGWIKREVKTHKIVQYIVSGEDILEGPNEWAGKHIPIVPVIATEVPLEHFRYRYGLIRFARDAQQLYNYYRTSAAEWINLAPKAPYLVTKGMVGPYIDMWNDQNQTPRPYLVYDHDPEVPNGPKRELPPALPTALLQEAQIAVEDLKATTGIFDASLGASSNERSGKAILARQKEGDTANFHFSDNLERALEYAGKILVDLIPKIYDSERVVRLMKPDEREEQTPINKVMYNDDGEPVIHNDITVGRYDVRVKIGPSFATKRQETSESLMQFMQAYPPAAELIGDLVAKNLDFPGAETMAKRLEATIPPEIREYDPDQGPPPPPPPDPMQEMMAQVEQSKAEAQMAQAEASVKTAEAANAKTEIEHKARMEQLAVEERILTLRLKLEESKSDTAEELADIKIESAEEMSDIQIATMRANKANAGNQRNDT